MIHTLHEDQLSVSSLGVRLVLKWSAELLNGHVSVKDSIICSTAVIRNTRVIHLRGYPSFQRANSWASSLLFQFFTPRIVVGQGESVQGEKKKTSRGNIGHHISRVQHAPLLLNSSFIGS